MASSVEIKMLNGPQLIANLKELRDDVAIKTVRASVRRIGKVLLDALIASVPRLTGNLARNLAIRAKYIFSRGVVVAKVIVNTRGKKGDSKNAFYWRFVEFDHRTRPSKDGGGAQRTISGKDFIRQTFARLQSQIQSIFYADLQKAIERAQRRSR